MADSTFAGPEWKRSTPVDDEGNPIPQDGPASVPPGVPGSSYSPALVPGPMVYNSDGSVSRDGQTIATPTPQFAGPTWAQPSVTPPGPLNHELPPQQSGPPVPVTKESLWEAIKGGEMNLFGDSKKYIGNTGNAVMHPQNTWQLLMNAGQGLPQAFASAPTTLGTAGAAAAGGAVLNQLTPPVQQMIGADSPMAQQAMTAAKGAGKATLDYLGKYMRNGVFDWDAFKSELHNHPVQTMNDLSIPMSFGATGLDAAGLATARTLAKTWLVDHGVPGGIAALGAQAVNPVRALNHVLDYNNPVNLAGRAASSGTRWATNALTPQRIAAMGLVDNSHALGQQVTNKLDEAVDNPILQIPGYQGYVNPGNPQSPGTMTAGQALGPNPMFANSPPNLQGGSGGPTSPSSGGPLQYSTPPTPPIVGSSPRVTNRNTALWNTGRHPNSWETPGDVPHGITVRPLSPDDPARQHGYGYEVPEDPEQDFRNRRGPEIRQALEQSVSPSAEWSSDRDLHIHRLVDRQLSEEWNALHPVSNTPELGTPTNALATIPSTSPAIGGANALATIPSTSPAIGGANAALQDAMTNALATNQNAMVPLTRLPGNTYGVEPPTGLNAGGNIVPHTPGDMSHAIPYQDTSDYNGSFTWHGRSFVPNGQTRTGMRIDGLPEPQPDGTFFWRGRGYTPTGQTRGYELRSNITSSPGGRVMSPHHDPDDIFGLSTAPVAPVLEPPGPAGPAGGTGTAAPPTAFPAGPAGSPGVNAPRFNAASNAAEANLPRLAEDIKERQALAQFNAIHTIGQTPQTLDNRIVARETDARHDYGISNRIQTTADAHLLDLLNRTMGVQRGTVMQRAAQTLGINRIPIMTGHYIPATATSAAVYPQFSGQALQAFKQAFDDYAFDHNVMSHHGISGTESQAIQGLRQQYLNWVGQSGHNPELITAMNNYADHSNAISRMQIGQYLERVMQNSTLGGSTAETRSAAFNHAIDNPINDARGNPTVFAATGNRMSSNISDVLTPQENEMVQRIRAEMVRPMWDDDKSAAASLFSGNINTAASDGSSHGAIHPMAGKPVAIFNALKNFVSGGADQRVSDRMSAAMMNPAAASQMMKNAMRQDKQFNAAGRALRTAGTLGAPAPDVIQHQRDKETQQ